MRTSRPLYDALAPTYEDHFAVPHRRAYDDLAWAEVEALLPPGSGPVVDAGCGVGRWARRLIARGHPVTGVEQSPGMIAELRRRPPGPGFTLVEGSMTDAELPPEAAAVLAMGSVQYTDDPAATIRRLAGWLRPGGLLMVLADSLVGLVLELLRDGKHDEAVLRLATRRGVWRQHGQEADLHLLDRDTLCAAFTSAGLLDVRAKGLLITAGPEFRGRLVTGPETHLALESRLADDPVLADTGKQLLVTGRSAATPAPPAGPAPR